MHRREALRVLAAATAAAAAPPQLLAAPRAWRFGYAAITWGGDDRRALADIEAVGFRGVQLRASAVAAFGERPSELRELLARHHLSLVALSSGTVSLDPARAKDELARHARHARFVRDVGGTYLQLIDERPKRAVTPADYAAMGRRLTEIGKRAADVGIPLGYHHHMDSLGESPEEIDRILAAADPRYVRLQLDTAHYLQGGGDPAAAIRRYGRDVLFLHLKDVEARPGGYRFVELGRGRVDLPGVFEALDEVGYDGWIVVELDAVTQPEGTPRASAEENRRYLTERLGLTV